MSAPKKARLVEGSQDKDEDASILQLKKLLTNLKSASTIDQFLGILDGSGKKIIVTNYFINGSASCKQMKPIFYQLARKYKDAIFLEINTDQCRDIAKAQGIFEMPSFVIYQNGQPVDQIKGAHPQELEQKIKSRYPIESKDGDVAPELSIIDNGKTVTNASVTNYIDFKRCECLNALDSISFRDFIDNKVKLVSDCDEQLILCYGFNQDLELHSFKIKAPDDIGPKSLKVFINLLTSLDFDNALLTKPTQEFQLKADDLNGEKAIEFYRVKFQKVKSIHIFVPENLSGSDKTEIESLTIYGSPVNKQKGIAGRRSEVVYLD